MVKGLNLEKLCCLCGFFLSKYSSRKLIILGGWGYSQLAAIFQAFLIELSLIYG
jgi:hypothetical protein